MSNPPGVSVSIFCGFIKLAEKEHGRKMAADTIEDIRRLLEEAEMLYRALPDEPKKSSNRK